MSTNAGLVTAALPRQDKARAEAEWPFEVGLVYLRDLVVDHTYQRPRDERFIKQIAEAFDPTLVGTIDVNARTDGDFAVLDGQQRVGGMTEAGKTACYCSIYRDLTIEDEAGFFFRKNRDRKTMLPYYSFRARAVAGDREAITIARLVESLGYNLGEKSNEIDTIGAIRAVEAAYRFSSPFRSESLSPALRTIRASGIPGTGRKGAFDTTVITGLARFWQLYEDSEVSEPILSTLLAEVGPVNFIGLVRERQGAGARPRNQSWTAARILVEQYNRRRKGAGQRLDIKRVAAGTSRGGGR